MPLYSYSCPTCGPFDSTTRANSIPHTCGLMARRNWSFRRGGEAFKPHFNHAVGEYVESDKQFRDALKRSGNTPIYPGDLQPTGDTQALEDQSRSWHNLKAKGDPRAFSQ